MNAKFNKKNVPNAKDKKPLDKKALIQSNKSIPSNENQAEKRINGEKNYVYLPENRKVDSREIGVGNTDVQNKNANNVNEVDNDPVMVRSPTRNKKTSNGLMLPNLPDQLSPIPGARPNSVAESAVLSEYNHNFVQIPNTIQSSQTFKESSPIDNQTTQKQQYINTRSISPNAPKLPRKTYGLFNRRKSSKPAPDVNTASNKNDKETLNDSELAQEIPTIESFKTKKKFKFKCNCKYDCKYKPESVILAIVIACLFAASIIGLIVSSYFYATSPTTLIYWKLYGIISSLYLLVLTIATLIFVILINKQDPGGYITNLLVHEIKLFNDDNYTASYFTSKTNFVESQTISNFNINDNQAINYKPNVDSNSNLVVPQIHQPIIATPTTPVRRASALPMQVENELPNEKIYVLREKPRKVFVNPPNVQKIKVAVQPTLKPAFEPVYIQPQKNFYNVINPRLQAKVINRSAEHISEPLRVSIDGTPLNGITSVKVLNSNRRNTVIGYQDNIQNNTVQYKIINPNSINYYNDDIDLANYKFVNPISRRY